MEFAVCIVNNPFDSYRQTTVPVTSVASLFNRFKKQSDSREFKNGFTQISFWGGSRPGPHLTHANADDTINNSANVNNLQSFANDHVDVVGASNNFGVGPANGYIFPKPVKVVQRFKNFGIRLGKFGHIYGTGAFHSHYEYPYEI